MQQNILNDDDDLIVNISKHDILPVGKYMFIEFYCTDPQCNCNNGVFQMVKLDDEGNETQNTIAIMDYTWSEPISIQNPSLDHQYVGSKLAEAGFDEFKKLLVSSDTMVKIKESYFRTREDFKDEQYQQIDTIRNINKIGHNESCPCGSGKKYKKCCSIK